MPAALAGLARQTLSRAEYEILLIDNNSTDCTPQIALKFARDYPDVNFTYVVEPNQGLSFARNRGISECHSDLIAFIDDDAVASSSYLQNLLSFFEQHPQVAAAGGKILPYYLDPSGPPEWLSCYTLGLISCLDLGEKLRPFPGFPLGCNMAFRIKLFDQLGRFDTELGRVKDTLASSEEKEFFARLKRARLPVYYVPGAVVLHIIPAERLAMDYLKRMSTGIGKSHRVMFQNGSPADKIQIAISQSFKAAAAFFIALAYWLNGKVAKAHVLVHYRLWFARGFFRKIMD